MPLSIFCSTINSMNYISYMSLGNTAIVQNVILFILVLGGGKCHLSNSWSHFENDMKNNGKKLKPVKV